MCTADICWALVILNNAPGNQERGETTESGAWGDIHSKPTMGQRLKFEMREYLPMVRGTKARTQWRGEGESNPRPLRSRGPG